MHKAVNSYWDPFKNSVEEMQCHDVMASKCEEVTDLAE